MSQRNARIVNPRRIYLTTAIPYVNGAPHIGHASSWSRSTRSRARGGLAATRSAPSPAPTTMP